MPDLPTLLERYEWLKDPLEGFLASHKASGDEPLLGAILYEVDNEPRVFEVFCGFGENSVSAGHEFFAVTLGRSEGFQVPEDKSTLFRMTNQRELRIALDGQWADAREVQAAAVAGNAEVVVAPDDEDLKVLFARLIPEPDHQKSSTGSENNRITFTVTPIDIIPMQRKLQEQAFLRGLELRVHWLGGVFKQTWAVEVEGDSKAVKEFIDWGNTHRNDIESPKLV